MQRKQPCLDLGLSSWAEEEPMFEPRQGCSCWSVAFGDITGRWLLVWLWLWQRAGRPGPCWVPCKQPTDSGFSCGEKIELLLVLLSCPPQWRRYRRVTLVWSSKMCPWDFTLLCVFSLVRTSAVPASLGCCLCWHGAREALRVDI